MKRIIGWSDDLPLNQSFCLVMKVDMLLELPSWATESCLVMTLGRPLALMLPSSVIMATCVPMSTCSFVVQQTHEVQFCPIFRSCIL